jgi:hypothetical protein
VGADGSERSGEAGSEVREGRAAENSTVGSRCEVRGVRCWVLGVRGVHPRT